ncbi:MAG: hypothetical protein AAGD96_16035, partial [Chloroflexota bacterium]
MKKYSLALLVLLISLVGCQIQFDSNEEASNSTSVPTPAEVSTDTPEPAFTPAVTLPTVEPEEEPDPPTAAPEEASEPEPPVAIENPTFPDPSAPKFSPINEPPTEAMLNAAEALRTNIPIPRDDVDLAKGYFGLSDADIQASLPVPNIDYQIGDIEVFSVNNFNINSYAVVNAELLGISEHAYFWFDETAGNGQPDAATVVAVGQEFDAIYKTVSSFFGVERQPGIDGHIRVHVLNASPLTLCRSSAEQTSIPPCG